MAAIGLLLHVALVTTSPDSARATDTAEPYPSRLWASHFQKMNQEDGEQNSAPEADSLEPLYVQEAIADGLVDTASSEALLALTLDQDKFQAAESDELVNRQAETVDRLADHSVYPLAAAPWMIISSTRELRR